MNIREVVDADGNVAQVTNYYPFGTPYSDSSATLNPSLQKHKYNGKELDTMHGLNTYDHGARQNYSILGRWDIIDPLCGKYYSVSPYVYCMNNPIFYLDKDGREPDGWGKELAVTEMAGGAIIATVGVVASGLGLVAEIPTCGGSTVVMVAGGDMAMFGFGMMAAGWATWNMNSNDNTYSSSRSVSSNSSSSSSTSVSPQLPQNNNDKKNNQANNQSNKNKGNSQEKKLSINQANRTIEKAQAPKGIKRVDPKNVNQTVSKDHVHFKNGRGAVNSDGTGHDGPRPKMTKEEIKFIKNIKGFENFE